jgi:hypothetical protein
VWQGLLQDATATDAGLRQVVIGHVQLVLSHLMGYVAHMSKGGLSTWGAGTAQMSSAGMAVLLAVNLCGVVVAVVRIVPQEGALQPVINLLSSTCPESQREAALLLGQFATQTPNDDGPGVHASKDTLLRPA